MPSFCLKRLCHGRKADGEYGAEGKPEHEGSVNIVSDLEARGSPGNEQRKGHGRYYPGGTYANQRILHILAFACVSGLRPSCRPDIIPFSPGHIKNSSIEGAAVEKTLTRFPSWPGSRLGCPLGFQGLRDPEGNQRHPDASIDKEAEDEDHVVGDRVDYAPDGGRQDHREVQHEVVRARHRSLIRAGMGALDKWIGILPRRQPSAHIPCLRKELKSVMLGRAYWS